MTCDREMLVLISAYADGEATPEESERAAEHLAGCTTCRKMVEGWQGHQQLFTWAYTREIPDGCTVDELIRRAGKAHPMTEQVVPRTVTQEDIMKHTAPRRWIWAAAVAAGLLIAFFVYQFITAHYFIRVGQQILTAATPRETRLGLNVDLTVGPHSTVRRVDARTLRVEKGWVAATVRGGSITVATPRLTVTDRGTKFHVGIGTKADYVTVEEGAVDVKVNGTAQAVTAGQALLAAFDGTFTQLTVPAKKPNEDKGAPLRANMTDVPTTIEAIQWEEGVARLATRFPNLHVSGGRGTSFNRVNNVDSIIGFESAATADYWQALRTHFPQIAHLLAGGTGDTGNWEVPVGVMLLAGISIPAGLADDVYYLHLAPGKGNILVWRFSGSRGGDVDVPLTCKIPSDKGFNVFGNHLFRQITNEDIARDGQITGQIMGYLLTDWPGAQKPYLEFRVNGPQKLALWQEERVMVTDTARHCASVPNLTLKYPSDQYYFLDAKHKHRLMIVWNQEAGQQLAQIPNQAGQDRVVVLAAINTELPLTDPPAPAGIYLLRLVMPAGGKSPSLELGTPGNERVPAWGGPSYPLLTGKPNDNGGGHSFSYSFYRPRANDDVVVECRLGHVYDGAFPFTFKVIDRSAGAWPGKTWTEGWVRINKL